MIMVLHITLIIYQTQSMGIKFACPGVRQFANY